MTSQFATFVLMQVKEKDEELERLRASEAELYELKLVLSNEAGEELTVKGFPEAPKAIDNSETQHVGMGTEDV